jgi:hypothetical protein
MNEAVERIVRANPVPGVNLADDDFVDSAALFSSIVSRRDGMTDTRTNKQQPEVAVRMPWYRHPALVAVSAAAAVAVVIGATALLFNGTDSPFAAPSPATTTPTITEAVTPTTVAVPAPTETAVAVVPVAVPMDWQRHSDDGVFVNSSILAVTAGGPGLVAGGIVFDEETYDGVWSPGTAALWVSESGRVWERIDDSMLHTGGDVPTDSAIRDLAAGPLGFVAVGSSGFDAAVWISPDGLSWTRVFDDDLSRDGNFPILGVTAGGPGWVAVGDGSFDAPVWVSSDGLDWTLIDDEDLLGGENVHADLYDVTVGGPGLVAVGSVGFTDGTGNAAQQAAVWVSEDGVDWRRLPADSFAGDRVFESVTADPASDRLIAFGTSDGIWHSSDGQDWLKIEQSPSSGLPPPSSSVGWDGDRIVAAGPDMALSVWVSLDGGHSWQQIARDGETFVSSDRANGVLVINSEFVVVGEAIGLPGEPPSGVVWIGKLRE